MQPQRRLHIALDALNLSHGGGTIVMARLSDALIEAGCEVTVLAARTGLLDSARLAPSRIDLHPNAQGAFKAQLFRRIHLQKRLRALKVDGVISFNYHSPVSEPQVTYHINVIPFLPFDQRRKAVGLVKGVLQAQAARSALAQSTANFFESQHLLSLAGPTTTPVEVAYTGIDIPSQAGARKPPDGPPRVVMITSGAPHKQNAIAARAFRSLLATEPKARLVIFGQPEPIRASLPKDLCDDPLFAEATTFRGYVGRETLYAEIGQAFALLTASELESFFMVALEAMIVGTPVVAADISSVRESCGPAGCLFPPGDADAAAQALLGLRDKELWSARSQSGYDWARQFDAATMARQFVRRALPFLGPHAP